MFRLSVTEIYIYFLLIKLTFCLSTLIYIIYFSYIFDLQHKTLPIIFNILLYFRHNLSAQNGLIQNWTKTHAYSAQFKSRMIRRPALHISISYFSRFLICSIQLNYQPKAQEMQSNKLWKKIGCQTQKKFQIQLNDSNQAGLPTFTIDNQSPQFYNSQQNECTTYLSPHKYLDNNQCQNNTSLASFGNCKNIKKEQQDLSIFLSALTLNSCESKEIEQENRCKIKQIEQQYKKRISVLKSILRDILTNLQQQYRSLKQQLVDQLTQTKNRHKQQIATLTRTIFQQISSKNKQNQILKQTMQKHCFSQLKQLKQKQCQYTKQLSNNKQIIQVLIDKIQEMKVQQAKCKQQNMELSERVFDNQQKLLSFDLEVKKRVQSILANKELRVNNIYFNINNTNDSTGNNPNKNNVRNYVSSSRNKLNQSKNSQQDSYYNESTTNNSKNLSHYRSLGKVKNLENNGTWSTCNLGSANLQYKINKNEGQSMDKNQEPHRILQEYDSVITNFQESLEKEITKCRDVPEVPTLNLQFINSKMSKTNRLITEPNQYQNKKKMPQRHSYGNYSVNNFKPYHKRSQFETVVKDSTPKNRHTNNQNCLNLKKQQIGSSKNGLAFLNNNLQLKSPPKLQRIDQYQRYDSGAKKCSKIADLGKKLNQMKTQIYNQIKSIKQFSPVNQQFVESI